MDATPPWNTTFSTDEKQADRFLEQVCSMVDAATLRHARHVVDIGCGDGGKIMRLAKIWPNMTFTGIDISAPNIRAAEVRRAADPARDRITLVLGDYREVSLPLADIIVSDSTLHLIPCGNGELFSKITGELTPGGLLLFTMPRRCVFNTALAFARRAARAIRSRWTDWLILALAKRLHGGAHSQDFLRERLPYMYIPPYRYGSRRFARGLLKQHHLALETTLSCAHASLGQAKHSFYAFRHVVRAGMSAGSGDGATLRASA
ncbi:MAG: class I SAM-dependent methyltransferase [Gemmataceae bacterium]